MTKDSDTHPNESRRSFLRKGSLTTGVLAIGLSSTGGVAAQNGRATNGQRSGPEALMVKDEFRPGALFRVKSQVLQQTPEIEGVAEGEIGNRYNVRIIEYLNTDEEVYFFPTKGAQVRQGEVYQFQSGFRMADDPSESLITVGFEPFAQQLTNDENQLQPGSDLEVVEGGGKALVRVDNFIPGALIVITTGIIDFVPPADVQGSDIASEYDSRLAEFLNTGEDLLVFTAHAAEIEQGGVYVIRDEFDITDPEGNLVTIELDRVRKSDVDDEFF